MPQKRGPFVVLSSREAYNNPWVTLREDCVRRPGGAEGKFGVLEMVHGSSVLAMEEDRSIWLVREYKYALGAESLEVVSGGIEPGESPEHAARRELEEELGITASDWTAWGRIDPFTTVVASTNYLFVARGLRQGSPRPEPGEEVTAVRMPLDEAVAMVERGEITHAGSVVLILNAARLGFK